ncbi:hypothetical protein K227x_35870 [Rubripirellula lacrimiformis]|uniref:Uncharacterized protein n=2 Tax=Pirellulaceae TaxID=2691357 RepID=A0A517NDQ2_9BACT|nr:MULTISPECIES: hypothetical protein [Pirellulaceae]QDT05188.1 hypothetical protein K227x_35870 [Rubripirellula lacrimiformis]TWU19853.1 hypothetical protein Poly21_20310 [Allorhodopirellula heiligendammensis]
MTLLTGIATVVVLLLIAVALLPSKKRDKDNAQSTSVINPFHSPAQPVNLREQQLQEESEAIASEYQRRSNEAWLDELSDKASTLLKAPAKPAARKS